MNFLRDHVKWIHTNGIQDGICIKFLTKNFIILGPTVYSRNIYQSQAVATWDPHKIGPIAGGSKFDTTCSIGWA